MSDSKSSTASLHEKFLHVFTNTDEFDLALPRYQQEYTLDKELLRELRNLPKTQFPEKDVMSTVTTKEDVLFLRFKDLDDINEVIRTISVLFTPGDPGSDFIMETIEKFLTTIRSTDELKELLCWQSNKVIRNIDGNAIGIEVYYKLTTMEEIGIFPVMDKKNTIIAVAYKYFTHIMNITVDQIPSWDKIKSVKIED